MVAFLEPVLSLLPEVHKPKRKQDGTDKLIWTCMALFVFLVCCQVPLYGAQTVAGMDPFYRLRLILASNKGTLMELGISPIVTASLMVQFFHGSHLFRFSNSTRDRQLKAGLEKLLSLLITFVQAFAYTMSGAYGDPAKLGVPTMGLIVAQLTFAGAVCILLDEMLTKGYGYGSGISLFVATSICESILWQAFSPLSPDGKEYEGALVYLAQQVVQEPNKLRALKAAFFRPYLPDVSSLLATACVFLFVNYVQGFAVTVNLMHRSGQAVQQKIRLFYTSSMPIVLHSALVTNVYIMSQSVASRSHGKSPLVQLLGAWKSDKSRGMMPISGLAYYLTPPGSYADLSDDHMHTLVSCFITVASCAFFSRTWVTVSNQSSKDLAHHMSEQGIVSKGVKQGGKDQLVKEFDRYVPVAASLGGACIGGLTLLSDLLGAAGSGTGVLLAVSTIHQYYEQLEEEKALPSWLRR
eukprot:Rhum_TRINITY_DN25320_c0_g1::Rhum_TRINITY_DN25320_c0_g1_i1::g.181828::m.181828/K10956/SEC61A; protein transport protein SEC61 subunit alpha